jgi:hypothetical protein
VNISFKPDKKNDKQILINIEFEVNYAPWESDVPYTLESHLTREFMLPALQEQLSKRLERIRRIAYEEGWRDKTEKKKKKRTEFSDTMEESL